MKIRADFVTNSSSSSYTVVRLKSPSLQEWLKTKKSSIGDLEDELEQVMSEDDEMGMELLESFKSVSDIILTLLGVRDEQLQEEKECLMDEADDLLQDETDESDEMDELDEIDNEIEHHKEIREYVEENREKINQDSSAVIHYAVTFEGGLPEVYVLDVDKTGTSMSKYDLEDLSEEAMGEIEEEYGEISSEAGDWTDGMLEAVIQKMDQADE